MLLWWVMHPNNSATDVFENGCRWTWFAPEVFSTWLAWRRVRGNLPHAPSNNQSYAHDGY